MITIRKSSDRGHINHGWLDTYHTFSFGEYYDPAHMSFRSLRVINEDYVKGGHGFPTHPHHDMEIITYVLEGALEHKDSLGTGAVIKPGEVQWMSAGKGIRHSEFNPSRTDPVHLLQIWITPSTKGLKPAYDQKQFPADTRRNRLALVASGTGAEGSIRINQDADLYASILEKGKDVSLTLRPERHAWVQVARGAISVNGTNLSVGDGAAVSGESSLKLAASEDSEVLVFDLA